MTDPQPLANDSLSTKPRARHPVPVAETDALQAYFLPPTTLAAAKGLMDRLVFEIAGRDDRFSVLLLTEHPESVSLGREASTRDLLASPDALQRGGVGCEWVGRGGGAVAHRPGQLAVYLVAPLERIGGLSPLGFRRGLEEAVAAACGTLKAPTERREDAPGLFCRAGRIARTGVAVRWGVGYHGLWLNVANRALDAAAARPLVRPGVPTATGNDGQGDPWPDRETSLEAVAGRPIGPASVREAVLSAIASRFGYSETLVASRHPWLVRAS